MANKYQILLIDDGTRITGFIKNFLQSYDFTAIAFHKPEDGIKFLNNRKVDFVILDVMLPGTDWFTILKEIRTISEVPVIMLSPRDATDRIIALELGADDCIHKPFDPYELLVKIQAVIRRSFSQSVNLYVRSFEGLTVNRLTEKVEVDGKTIHLTTAEYEVFKLFIDNPNENLNREFIIEHLKGIQWEATNRSVDLLVSRLRKKLLEDINNPRYIKTVHGEGYKFIGKPIS
ncbi:MAG: response regulator transcription factor [Candidatus Marinimicrobia bacterium]|nr:response regulator transcription factor [Candidatus Neomarinimicrobiota bacterium]MBL7022446.1 response regulator transcription factor [Candidatus Neomarinimicrobiota bacterium]MBL7108699.1 response regulator transcription factor [Candidatus Neomarinimicrobiota bacterium]